MHTSVTLPEIALEALVTAGFRPVLEEAAERELAALEQGVPRLPDVRDLRGLLWCSIDNAESRDLDQVEHVEQLPDGALRVRIGIAGVDHAVPKDSALDQHAFANATSVYTGIEVFPMLPPGITSLNEGEDRAVVVVELTLERDGAVRGGAVYRALAVNRAKLDYESTGAWLEGTGVIPTLVLATPGLESQLWLQDRAASLLK